MRTLRRALFLAVVGLLATSVVAGQAASADTGGDEMDFVARINGLRASEGLAPLAVKGELFDLARAWSARMATTGAIAHNPSLSAQAPPSWKRLGENVGTGSEVAGVFEAFVRSPVHVANMVDPAFESVGVGVVRADSGQQFVTMTFMTGGSVPKMVKKVVRVCSKNGKGRTVCVRRLQLMRA